MLSYRDLRVAGLPRRITRREMPTPVKWQKMVQVPHARHEFECQGLEGMTLRDVTEHAEGVGAETLSEYIECACSGVMACSTCHVVIEPDHFHMVGPPDEAEQVCADRLSVQSHAGVVGGGVQSTCQTGVMTLGRRGRTCWT